MNRKLVLKYLFRAMVAVALAWVGFQVEHLYQVQLAKSSSNASDGNKTTILLLGGSIANGMAPRIEEYLSPTLGAKVVEYTQAMLESEQIRLEAAHLIETHHPTLLLLQVGLSESPENDAEWMNRARGVLGSKDESSFMSLAKEAIEQGLRPTQKLIRLVMQNRKLITELRFEEPLLGLIKERLMGLVGQVEHGAEIADQIDELVVLSQILANPNSGLLAKSAQTKAGYALTSFKRLVKMATEWPGELKRLGTREFVGSAGAKEFYERVWFCGFWIGRGGGKNTNGLAYFTENPKFILRVYGWPFDLAGQPDVAKITGRPAPQELWDALVNNRDYLGFEIFHDLSVVKKESAHFRENVKAVVELARQSHIEVALLQYPNLDVETVAAVGRELNIPVIECGHFFEEKFAERGRDAFFMDRIGETGHLTEEGLAVYGKFVAEKLNQILNGRQEGRRAQTSPPKS